MTDNSSRFFSNNLEIFENPPPSRSWEFAFTIKRGNLGVSGEVVLLGEIEGENSGCPFISPGRHFHLYLHASSLNLLIYLRQETEKEVTPETVGLPGEVLEKTATPDQKKLYFNRRRRHADPLGEGFACTWSTDGCLS